MTTLLLAGRLRFEASIRRIEGNLSGLLLELFGGIIALRSAGAEGLALARWAAPYGDRLRLLIRSRRFSNALHQWLAVYPILTAMVVYTGAIYIDPGLMKAGRFLAFNMAFANLVAGDPGGLLYRDRPCWTCCRWCSGSGRSSRRVPEFPAAVIEPVRLAGALALNRVAFRYPGQDPGHADPR